MSPIWSDNAKNLVRKNIPLAPYSTFQIGGPADFFSEPETPEQFIDLIQYAQKENISFFVLGGGSNTLFHDKGFRGLVIHPIFRKITIGPNGSIHAESGALLSRLIQKALEQNLGGIEMLVGLPGTVGGAIRGNAGAEGIEIKDILESTDVYNLKNQTRKIIPAENLDFSYRHSIFKENKNLFILGGTFQLKKTNNTAPLHEKMTEILKKRTTTQPKGKSAGCIFKNPVIQTTQNSSTGTVSKSISAGRLIDECGLKGTRIGDIEISNTHGNFFLNHGKGTQKDVLDLIKITQEKIKKEKGHDLEIEIEILNADMLK